VTRLDNVVSQKSIGTSRDGVVEELEVNLFITMESDTLNVGDRASSSEKDRSLLFGVILGIAFNFHIVLFSLEEPSASNGIVVGFFNVIRSDLKQGVQHSSLNGATSGNTFRSIEGSGDFHREDFLDGSLDDGDSGTTTDDFNAMKGDGDLRLEGFEESSESFNNRGDDFFEFISGQNVSKIVVFNNVVDIDSGFVVSRKDLSLFFNSIDHSQSGLFLLDGVGVVLISTDLSVEFQQFPIDISNTEASFVDLVQDFSLLVSERGDKSAGFAVTEIDEEDVSCGGGKFSLSEDTITQSDSSRFVQKSDNVNLSDFSSIQQGFSFLFGVVTGDGNNNITVRNIIVSDVLLKSLEHHGSDLFRSELSGFSFIVDVKSQSVIRGGADGIVEPFLFILVERSINTDSQESVGIDNSVLEVGFQLNITLFTDESFGFTETNNNTGFSVRGFINNNFDTSLFSNCDDSRVTTKVNTN